MAIEQTILAINRSLQLVLTNAAKSTGYNIPNEEEYIVQIAYKAKNSIEIIRQVITENDSEFDAYTLAGISYKLLIENTLTHFKQIILQMNESEILNKQNAFMQF